MMTGETSILKEYHAEREEILKHKWVLSEQAGKDVGFEFALMDWVCRHRGQWRKAREFQRHEIQNYK